MNPKDLLTEDNAVSPVIGVILMVAITVILAAVIATFVLGLGQQVSKSAPRASFTFDYNGDGTDDGSANCEFGGTADLTITHDGGDTIEAQRMTIGDSDNSQTWDTCAGSGVAATSEIKAGDEITGGTDLEIQSTDTVRVIWTSQSGEDSATLAQFEGPDA